MKNYFKNSFELDEPIVSCNIGIKSLYDCYSFTLPINYDKFSISSHLTSQLLGSLIALVSSFSTSNTSLSTKIKHFSNSHINYHQNYKSSGLLSLTLQYLYGNLSIGFLIKQELPIIETSKKVKIFNNCKKIIEESQNLGFVEAVCGVIIGICHNYENLTFGIRVDENVVKMYEKMISSGVGSYVAITSRIIADNVKK